MKINIINQGELVRKENCFTTQISSILLNKELNNRYSVHFYDNNYELILKHLFNHIFKNENAYLRIFKDNIYILDGLTSPKDNILSNIFYLNISKGLVIVELKFFDGILVIRFSNDIVYEVSFI